MWIKFPSFRRIKWASLIDMNILHLATFKSYTQRLQHRLIWPNPSNQPFLIVFVTYSASYFTSSVFSNKIGVGGVGTTMTYFTGRRRSLSSNAIQTRRHPNTMDSLCEDYGRSNSIILNFRLFLWCWLTLKKHTNMITCKAVFKNSR